MDAIAVSELARLQAMPAEDLRLLPPLTTQEVQLADARIKVDCFHRVLPGGAHMIVIVAWRPGAHGIWHEPHVEGFVFDGAGVRRPLTQEESWEFT